VARIAVLDVFGPNLSTACTLIQVILNLITIS
jgi:hypothetical protein